ncbi:hypothetical protein P7K49_032632 [Saguinus oedipus]|uniref:Uncharacterized protein n=1 Tax=Saguinus oedipus TaxID=9490 RepID=A0ABQ9TYU8_SAGOE|nr:hypothetical protein P7K49_032632 [Saguinus oedipus]
MQPTQAHAETPGQAQAAAHAVLVRTWASPRGSRSTDTNLKKVKYSKASVAQPVEKGMALAQRLSQRMQDAALYRALCRGLLGSLHSQATMFPPHLGKNY